MVTGCQYGGTKRSLCHEDDCVICDGLSFASHPKSSMWCYDLNDKTGYIPRYVTKTSTKKFYFYCDICGHYSYQLIRNISKSPTGCPFCAVGSRCFCDDDDCNHCHSKSFASHWMIDYWCYHLNEDIDPRYVTKGSTQKYWFLCPDCNHEYLSSPNSFSRNRGCPYCASQKLCDDPECNFCYYKSFASSEYAEYWSENNDKTARQVHLNSNLPALFYCKICRHEYQKKTNTMNNCPCSFCSVKTYICGLSDCDFCYPKTFASHPMAYRWSDKNKTKPHQSMYCSNDKFRFDCDECGHEYWKALNCFPIVGNGCPYCSCKKLCSDPECTFCLKNSFAGHYRSKYIQSINPRTIFRGTDKQYPFICEKGHEFKKSPNSITCYGSWCPLCINKTEARVYEFLLANFGDVVKEKKFLWCRLNEQDRSSFYRFDFYIPSLKLLIEIDGRQHFEQVLKWESPELNTLKDVHKMKLALSNGFSVLRIIQEDIQRDKYDWETELLLCIKKYDEPTIEYVTTTNAYRHHTKAYHDNTVEELALTIKELLSTRMRISKKEERKKKKLIVIKYKEDG